MRHIDPHLHTVLLDDGQMMKIALSGMEACVTPMLHSLNGINEADVVLRMWERFLDFEVKRGGSIGYETFVSLSVPFYGLTDKGAEECLKRLPEYLEHERVVAMGEMGLDTGTDHEKVPVQRTTPDWPKSETYRSSATPPSDWPPKDRK